MATFVTFHEFGSVLGQKLIDMDSDTFRVALVAAANAPNQGTFDELADLTQISAGNGYTQVADGAGLALASVTYAESGAGTGIWVWDAADFVFTASGGSIATFRYVVLVDDTSTNNKLVGYWDSGADQIITVGNTFTGVIGANGILRLTVT